MGEMITEPSMEEILSSIKRIIAEEGDGPGRGRRLGRTGGAPESSESDPEVLNPQDLAETSEPAEAQTELEQEPEPAMEAHPEPVAGPAVAAPPEPQPSVQSPAPVTPLVAEPILSSTTAEASRGPLEALSRLVVKPEPRAAATLEETVQDMLRPMLRDWLDANLPALVEKMVASEIARITGQRR